MVDGRRNESVVFRPKSRARRRARREQLASIALELVLDIEIQALLGTVRQGRLMDLQVGPVMAKGALLCESVRLAGGTAHLDPNLAVQLGRGLPLVREP